MIVAGRPAPVPSISGDPAPHIAAPPPARPDRSPGNTACTVGESIWRSLPMLKFLIGAVIVIFLIGLLVVSGVLGLIF